MVFFSLWHVLWFSFIFFTRLLHVEYFFIISFLDKLILENKETKQLDARQTDQQPEYGFPEQRLAFFHSDSELSVFQLEKASFLASELP